LRGRYGKYKQIRQTNRRQALPIGLICHPSGTERVRWRCIQDSRHSANTLADAHTYTEEREKCCTAIYKTTASGHKHTQITHVQHLNQPLHSYGHLSTPGNYQSDILDFKIMLFDFLRNNHFYKKWGCIQKFRLPKVPPAQEFSKYQIKYKIHHS